MIHSKYFSERITCPICNKSDFISIYSLAYKSEEMLTYLKEFYGKQGGVKDFSVFNNVNYELMQCSYCDLIFQKFVPNDNLMFLLYEEFINPEIKKLELTTGERYQLEYFQRISAEIEYLLKMIKQPPVKIKFLDYGMGWGLLCNMAKAFGCDTYGTELSPSRIEYAKANGIKIIKDNDLKDMKFDIINLSDVLEHLTNPMQTIKDLINCLNPNGVLRISVPSERKIKENIKNKENISLYSRELNCVSPLEHINCFSPTTLLYLAKVNNLKIVGFLDFAHHINIEHTINQKIKYLIKKYFLYWHYSKISTNIALQKI